MREDFAVLILSNGRADKVTTIDFIHKCGYTGKWYLILDDEDKQVDKYKVNFGEDHIIIFNKTEIGKTFDIMDNFEGNKVPTFARNAIPIIAKDLGLTYFLELEDDYKEFVQRYSHDGKWLRTAYVRDLDAIINEMLEFLDTTGALTVCFSQYGDLIGGTSSSVFQKRLTRKAMNTFFCRVDKPFQFLGRFNDDVNAYIDYGKRGDLMFTISDISIWQPPTQARAGGISESYKQFGTYVKSFYSVMLRPDCVKVYEMGQNHKRLHHLIDWELAVPKIISSKFRNYES